MRSKAGFTLVELLVVLAILSLLAALVFPVFNRVRAKSHETVCLSNLHQIGRAIALYTTDYDEHIPHALDAFTKENFTTFYPVEYEPAAKQIPVFTTIIQPYLKSALVLRCPSEHLHSYERKINYYETYGCSYNYHVVYPVLLGWKLGDFIHPAEQILLNDQTNWHDEGSDAFSFRMNELFADFHARNVTWIYYLETIYQP